MGGAIHELLMKSVARMGLLPNENFSSPREKNCEEETVGREGHVGRIRMRGLEEKLGIPSIPDQKLVQEAEGESGACRKEPIPPERFYISHLVWDRQRIDRLWSACQGEIDFPDGDVP